MLELSSENLLTSACERSGATSRGVDSTSNGLHERRDNQKTRGGKPISVEGRNLTTAGKRCPS